jgi:hypothetical protein
MDFLRPIYATCKGRNGENQKNPEDESAASDWSHQLNYVIDQKKYQLTLQLA